MGKTPWAPGAPALAAAARAVDAVVFRGESVDAALSTAADMGERAAVHAIALGTVRWYLRLAPAIESLLQRPQGVANPVRALLAAAAHQIEYSRNAPELTAHLAVDAARLLGAERSTGLVNAVLRRFVAERAARLGKVDATVPGRTAHPGWLVKEISRAWGELAPSVLEANNAHPPMTLRLDLSRTTRADYVARLTAAGIDSQENMDAVGPNFGSPGRRIGAAGVRRGRGFSAGLGRPVGRRADGPHPRAAGTGCLCSPRRQKRGAAGASSPGSN